MKHVMEPPGANNADDWIWLTKAVALLAILTGLLYGRALIDEGVLAGNGRFPVGGVTLLAVLLAALTGLLIGWRWPPIGGPIAIAGGLLLALLVYYSPGRDGWLASLIYGSPFVVSGGLYLWLWRKLSAIV